jgi:hypothetical protein
MVEYRSKRNSISLQLVKIEAKMNFSQSLVRLKTKRTAFPKINSKIEAKASWFSLQCRQDETKRNIDPTLSTTRRNRPGCCKILEKQSEAKGISPILSKSKVKRISMFQKFVQTEQKEVKSFKILQDRSKTNIFVSNCAEGEKRKKTKLRFFGTKRRKTNIIVLQLSKICHC